MDPKVTRSTFTGVFLCALGSCSGVSQPASKGLAPIVLGVLEGASSNGLVFSLMDSKGDVRHFFGVRFCMAWARILLLFGCFATGLQRTCANRFGCFGRGVVQWLGIFFNGFQR